MSRSVAPALHDGWPSSVDRFVKARPWASDAMLALVLAVVLGSLTVSALPDMATSRVVLVGLAFGAVHLSVAFRRTALTTAYVVASLAMLVVVLAPDARMSDAGAGGPRDVPMLLMPSSLAFLPVLYTVAVQGPRRLRLVALPVALVGAAMATVRVVSAVEDVYPGDSWWLYRAVVAGSLLVSALATWGLGSLQLVRRQRAQMERAEGTRLAIYEERARIARDMHDIVAHSLAVIVRQAEGAAVVAPQEPERAAEALRAIADTGRDALDDMRGLLGVLRAPATDVTATAPQVSLADLPEMLERVRDTGLDAGLAQSGSPFEIGKAGELATYRVVQEALTNVVKHAGPQTRVQVRLDWSTDSLTVGVEDDGGAGAPPGAVAGTPPRREVLDSEDLPGSGAGLPGLRERVTAVGGTFAARRLGRGFQVRATFPRRSTGGVR